MRTSCPRHGQQQDRKSYSGGQVSIRQARALAAKIPASSTATHTQPASRTESNIHQTQQRTDIDSRRPEKDRQTDRQTEKNKNKNTGKKKGEKETERNFNREEEEVEVKGRKKGHWKELWRSILNFLRFYPTFPPLSPLAIPPHIKSTSSVTQAYSLLIVVALHRSPSQRPHITLPLEEALHLEALSS